MLPRRNSKGGDCRDQNSLKRAENRSSPCDEVQTWGGCKGRWGRDPSRSAGWLMHPYLQMEGRHGNSDPNLQGTDLKSQNAERTKGKTHTHDRQIITLRLRDQPG